MPSERSTDIRAFAASQLTLLDIELKAELAETSLLVSQSTPRALQRAGCAIVNLCVTSQRTGLEGRTVIDLELDPALGQEDLPEHGIRTGDIVSLQGQPSKSATKKDKLDLKGKASEGVITRVARSHISIALNKEDDDLPQGKLWILKLANDVTYKRMGQTLERLQKLHESEYSPLVQTLFGMASPTASETEADKNVEFFDSSLNDSQKDAVRFAMAAGEVALIHGPPGTGKTHTLIELIRQMLKYNKRLLICGPSNISVDNIVERLAPHRIRMVRLGHPARLLPSVLDHSLDVLTHTSEAAVIVRDVRKELDEKQSSIRKTRNGRERRAIYGEMKELRKEYRERERNCIQNLIKGSTVVLATLHTAGGHQLRHQDFDAVIIDEASQALEAQCWVPLIGAKKVILAGDHLQLPPTVKSLKSAAKEASKNALQAPLGIDSGLTLETTLFDRLLTLYGSSIKRMLTIQYRMNETIMRFPSDQLYDGQLRAADRVRDRLLRDLAHEVQDTDDTREPLIFYDTQGGDFPEQSDDVKADSMPRKRMEVGESKSNDMEAALVRRHVRVLVKAGVRPEDIAVITPYNAQLSILSHGLKTAYPGIELGSIDGFQGREKEAVIVSLVRSNTEHEVGFLREKRRLNGIISATQILQRAAQACKG